MCRNKTPFVPCPATAELLRFRTPRKEYDGLLQGPPRATSIHCAHGRKKANGGADALFDWTLRTADE